MAHLSMGQSLRRRLYAITGNTATVVPGDPVVATYSSMSALRSAVLPTAQGELIQVAGAPSPSALGLYEGRYIDGTWLWVEV
jgi:hypothetical protein